ncbi:MAG TPA: alpha-ketoglutarate-dependent dioxygenase AlkB [Flavobacterium sp.]|nr:alpha-ketoglutarate-dependent dioxygenase AlkB [Flavobacterium sp.]
MESLFNDNSEPFLLNLPDADVIYYPGFFTKSEADKYFPDLLQNTPWQQDNIKVFGKIHAQPRLTALFGDEGKTLSYSGITMDAHHWNKTLLEIKSKIKTVCETEFNTVLLNYYRDGKDSNGWHADNEPYLGTNPVIASVTFGAERAFHLKHDTLDIPTQKITLEHGSLLLMKGKTQHFWKHQIPKTAKPIGPRINLTFRVVA